jgi:hypothetical protein
MSNLLIYPMGAHVGLVALLYAMLTVARAPAVWGLGRRPDGSNPWVEIEPRLSANLSNQFEWPLFFYAACLLLSQQQVAGTVQLTLAWTFIAGRVLHSCVQIFTGNIRLRGAIFTINFLAVLGMWSCLLLSVGRAH